MSCIQLRDKNLHNKFIDIFYLTTQSKGSPSSEESPPTSMPQAEGEKQETTTAEIPGVQYKVQCLGCFQYPFSLHEKVVKFLEFSMKYSSEIVINFQYALFSNPPLYTFFASQSLHKLLFSNAPGSTAFSQEHLKTKVNSISSLELSLLQYANR